MSARDPNERYSRWRLRLFGRYAERYFLGHFNSLRTLRAEPTPQRLSRTILFANHPSWWDPIVLLLFATRCWSAYRVFAPIDAAALERYSILERFGMFGVTPSPRGARRFWQIANRVLQDPDATLALTPQGRFVDVRERPVVFAAGLAHLLMADPSRRAIPVALEYTHWTERLPEALVGFGRPLACREGETEAALHVRLEVAQTELADRLAAASRRRDADAFDVELSSWRRGPGGLYGLYERVRAAGQGRAYRAAHQVPEDRRR